MLAGSKHKPILVYIALAIVVISLALTFIYSRTHENAAPAAAPLHEQH